MSGTTADSPVTWIQGPVIKSLKLSTIGAKAIVAVTGLLLIGFLLAHLAGNLLIFQGPDAINKYGAWLKSLGPLLWVARVILLILFVTHVALALLLVRRSREARPQKYVFERTQVASVASRYMFQSGLVILVFLIYHLAHYTLGLTHSANGAAYLELKDPQGRHDVFRMVVAGFSNIWIAGFYILCQIILATHLFHGATSMFQTWGLNHFRYNGLIQRIGLIIALIIGIGNCSIPLAIQFGLIK